MKKFVREEKPTHQNIGATLFVFVGFVSFILVFASLGSHESFREARLEAAAMVGYGEVQLTEENQVFLETYMPYFHYFALHYTSVVEEI